MSHFGGFSTDTAFEVTFVKGKLLLNLNLNKHTNEAYLEMF